MCRRAVIQTAQAIAASDPRRGAEEPVDRGKRVQRGQAFRRGCVAEPQGEVRERDSGRHDDHHVERPDLVGDDARDEAAGKAYSVDDGQHHVSLCFCVANVHYKGGIVSQGAHERHFGERSAKRAKQVLWVFEGLEVDRPLAHEVDVLDHELDFLSKRQLRVCERRLGPQSFFAQGEGDDKQAGADKGKDSHGPLEADRRVQLVENQREHHAAHGPAEGGNCKRTGPLFHEIVRHHSSERRHQEAERCAGNDTKHKHKSSHRLALARKKKP
ncbi:hypothetical protein KL939_002144 [Ogataea angusta]|nr:hypothetical protein KL939_002144 [Ogataea angusta]